MNNFDYCVYTYRHRQAIMYLVNKLPVNEMDRKILLKRAKWHDLDKVLMYMYLPKKTASEIHKKISHHHMRNQIPKSKYDYYEAILDYESGGYTKPDKPYSAYDYILMKKDQFSKEVFDNLMNTVKELGLAYSHEVVASDPQGIASIISSSDVTENMIKEEIKEYISYIKNFLN